MKKMASTINAMHAGDGPHSYVRNSSYQGGITDIAKPIIEEEIATKLDAGGLISTSSICIADFGCSTGGNSFPTMQIIIQAIKQKIVESSSSSLVKPPKAADFYVFFNDSIANDFNTLFTSLPSDRVYRAIGVPGDFHGCLLPKSSLHFAYTSWSLHWLTEAPKAMVNKGRIFHTKERKKVCDAYLDQYSRDIESFLESRAFEMVPGGLIALLVPGVPDYLNPEREYTIETDIHILGSCLMDMAKKGRLSEAKVDSFNFPWYFTTPQQMKAILKNNKSFTTERMEILNNPGKHTLPGAHARASAGRAVLGRLLTDHFGTEITDELFNLYTKKIEASPVFKNSDNDKMIMVLAVLKRKNDYY